MSPVYWLHNPEGDFIHPNPFKTKEELRKAAYDFHKLTTRIPFYTMNQHESPHYFTAEELAEPTPQAEPREFKLGDVVRVKGIDSPKMIVRTGPTPTLDGIDGRTIKVHVFWFDQIGAAIYDAFEPALLMRAD